MYMTDSALMRQSQENGYEASWQVRLRPTRPLHKMSGGLSSSEPRKLRKNRPAKPLSWPD